MSEKKQLKIEYTIKLLMIDPDAKDSAIAYHENVTCIPVELYKVYYEAEGTEEVDNLNDSVLRRYINNHIKYMEVSDIILVKCKGYKALLYFKNNTDVNKCEIKDGKIITYW